MKTVYNLNMIDMECSYDNYVESFHIGFFSSYDIAEKTARRYMNEVNGFKDHNVQYQITEKIIVDSDEDIMPQNLFVVYGWNENDRRDEIDVVESECYVTEQEAEKKLNELKSSYSRKNWCVEKYTIDECEWKDGFERYIYKL